MEGEQTKSIVYKALNKVVRKKAIKEHVKEKEKNKKRVEAENWTFDVEYYAHEKQLNMIQEIVANNCNYTDNVSKIAVQQIHRKIYGYKQQDLIKKLFKECEFITFDSIVHKMIECQLKCYYCSTEMSVLYDVSREMKQWTVDRIDNDLGHNITNYYLACLECNLKRRRRSDDKFLFTKQLKIIKTDSTNKINNDSLIE
jgi:hypothetical protein